MALKNILQGKHAMVEASKEVYSALHRRFNGDLVRPGDGGYQDARAIWNGMVARTPGLIARRTVDNIVNRLKVNKQELKFDIESVTLPQIACWFFGL